MIDVMVSPLPVLHLRSRIRGAALASWVLGAPRVDLALRPQQGPAHSGGLREAIQAQYGHRCLACGSDGPLTIDHIVPVSNGGANTAANVQPLCGPCNSSKATKTIDYRPDQAAVSRK